jgi:hypothetical protein
VVSCTTVGPSGGLPFPEQPSQLDFATLEQAAQHSAVRNDGLVEGSYALADVCLHFERRDGMTSVAISATAMR